MKNYLLELGTEELPVDFINSATEQLTELLETKLNEARLTFEDVKVLTTPRRIALIITGLADKQDDISKSLRGPTAQIAFKEGQPTPAAVGFCKKLGISPNQLVVEVAEGKEYVFANIEEKGKPAGEILQIIIPTIVLGMKGSHFMRWAGFEEKFQRPIRWIVSLLDQEQLPVTIANVSSSNITRGHRILAPEPVAIPSIDQYKETLKKAYVLVDPEERKERVVESVNASTEKIQATAKMTEDLVNLVTNLVEWPSAEVGTFDEKYLEIPEEVITTVMIAHQKYFPVFNKETNKLQNNFICINNREPDPNGIVVKGNQRVLKARLDDGAFYFKEDTKKSLQQRVEDLKGMTFQKGLGTMYNKSERIVELVKELASQANITVDQTEKAVRAAQLCKADLPSNLVREFTELEGVIGKIFALNDGEDPLVAEGIAEHYLPRSAEDTLPKTITGTLTAIADKMDTITSVFALGKIPSGSADPLGLRRAALGIVLIILNSEYDFNTSKLVELSFELLENIGKNTDKDIVSKVKDFIQQRVKVILTEKNYRHDVIDAIMSSKDPLVSVKDTLKRAELLSALVKQPDYNDLHESANRIIRMVKGKELKRVINTELFENDCEKELNTALNAIDTEVGSYEKILDQLKSMTPLVETFFDKVLVMVEDDAVKNNRLALLTKAASKYKYIADFSKVDTSKN